MDLRDEPAVHKRIAQRIAELRSRLTEDQKRQLANAYWSEYEGPREAKGEPPFAEPLRSRLLWKIMHDYIYYKETLGTPAVTFARLSKTGAHFIQLLDTAYTTW